jgi:hypothetical protein
MFLIYFIHSTLCPFSLSLNPSPSFASLKLRESEEGKERHIKPFPLALLRRSGYAKARGETGKGVI